MMKSLGNKKIPFHESQKPSPLLMKFANTIALDAPGPILDVACGYGRNSNLFASLGCKVICLDNDSEVLNCISSLSNTTNSKGYIKPTPVYSDLKKTKWIFPPNSFGAIINVHFFLPSLLKSFVISLMPKGYLFIETISGHGENYLELPSKGFILDSIKNQFDVFLYEEKKVGPLDSDAVTVKLFAKKR